MIPHFAFQAHGQVRTCHDVKPIHVKLSNPYLLGHQTTQSLKAGYLSARELGLPEPVPTAISMDFETSPHITFGGHDFIWPVSSMNSTAGPEVPAWHQSWCKWRVAKKVWYLCKRWGNMIFSATWRLQLEKQLIVWEKGFALEEQTCCFINMFIRGCGLKAVFIYVYPGLGWESCFIYVLNSFKLTSPVQGRLQKKGCEWSVFFREDNG